MSDPLEKPTTEQPQRRRRLGAPVETIESFTGTPATDPIGEEPARANTIDDDLDPGGKPYRAGRDGSSPDPRLPGGWGRIVRSVFRIDEEAAFARLSKVTFAALPSRMSYGERVDALDECSGMAVLASQLAENAKQVLALYEIDVDVLRAPMYREAREKIAAERSGKVIAAADVDKKVAELWPEEYRRQEENLAKAKGAVAHVRMLADRWSYRAREIDTLVRTSPHS